MAGPNRFMWEALEERLVAELKNVVWEWKSKVSEEVFLRWTQGRFTLLVQQIEVNFCYAY